MRYKRPDHKNALSILNASEKEMHFTLQLPVTEQAGSTIIRNVYECFRMIGDALLTFKGSVAQDHVPQINELLKLRVKTTRPIGLINNLRQLRHNINYYGYAPNIAETEDVISLAKACFPALLAEARKIIGEK